MDASRWRFPSFPVIGGIALVLALVAARGAGAQPSGDNVITVKELFDQAMTEMQTGDFNSACPKLERAAVLDPKALNVLAKLAKCYENAGKLASAYGAYLRLEIGAKASGDSRFADTAEAASRKATELKPRLASLTITLLDASGSVSRDGAAIPATEFAAPFPIDAGTHEIRVKAPHHDDWVTSVTVKDGEASTIRAELGPARPDGDAARGDRTRFWGPVRYAAIPIASVGVGAIAGAIAVGVYAKGIYNESNASGQCSATTDRCATQAGRDQRARAVNLAHVGTGAFVAGVGLAVIGAGMLAFAPPTKIPLPASGASSGLHVVPLMGLTSVGVRGDF